jgi:hypothetical protein
MATAGREKNVRTILLPSRLDYGYVPTPYSPQGTRGSPRISPRRTYEQIPSQNLRAFKLALAANLDYTTCVEEGQLFTGSPAMAENLRQTGHLVRSVSQSADKAFSLAITPGSRRVPGVRVGWRRGSSLLPQRCTTAVAR